MLKPEKSAAPDPIRDGGKRPQAAAVTPSWFDAAMAACLAEAAGTGECPQTFPALAVGCSGGPDSMALTCLLQAWALRRSISLTALIVNHGLRPEAAAEAACVADWLTERGVSAQVLTHEGPKPKSNIQAEARTLRYALMRDWCINHGVPVLAIAHHLEDQAETFLLRLARGSGVDGLAAMGPVASLPGDPYRRVTLIRPVLDTPKADLHAYLQAAGWPFVEDPSNRDIRHARVRMRNLAGVLAMEGLDAKRLARTARTMRRARSALEAATDSFLRTQVSIDPYGYAGMDRAAFSNLEDELALRALTRLLQLISGNGDPFRFDRLDALAAALRSDDPVKARTLAGCRVEKRGEGILIFREAAAIGAPVPAQPAIIWDRRFALELSGDLNGLAVGKLGVEGVAQSRAKGLGEDRFGAVPGPARAALPGLWCGDKLVAIPHIQSGLTATPADLNRPHFTRASFEGVRARGRPFSAAVT